MILMSAVIIIAGCNQSKKEMVKKELFGTYKGGEVYLLTLTNKAGNVLKLTNFGARITWIEVPDKDGNKDNITFGFDTGGWRPAGGPRLIQPRITRSPGPRRPERSIDLGQILRHRPDLENRSEGPPRPPGEHPPHRRRRPRGRSASQAVVRG